MVPIVDGLLEGALPLQALQREGRFPENHGPENSHLGRRLPDGQGVARAPRRAMDVKKGYLVEQALRHHLQALQELPADVIVDPTLVLTRKSGEGLLKEIEPPTR